MACGLSYHCEESSFLRENEKCSRGKKQERVSDHIRRDKEGKSGTERGKEWESESGGGKGTYLVHRSQCQICSLPPRNRWVVCSTRVSGTMKTAAVE